MEYVVSILIICLCIYLIGQPFFKKETKWQAMELKDDLDSLTLEQIYVTLNELEMEYNMGKLTEKDYYMSKKHYENLAAQKLKEEAFAEESEADNEKMKNEIEKELEELRKERKETR